MALRRLLPAALLLLCASGASANLCVSGDTLAQYIALGAAGCTDGTDTVHDFSFSVGPASLGFVPVAANDIVVTTPSGAGFVGLKFASTGFSVSGTDFVNYQIVYTWDPSGDLRDILDPPSGNASVTTNGCAGFAFAGGLCAGTLFTETVNPLHPVAATTYSAVPVTLGIENELSLNAPASFEGIENDAVTPEPGGATLIALGIATIVCYRLWMSRRRRSQA